MKRKEIYLDGASNTPLDKEVLKTMMPYLSEKFMGNSSSAHDFGIKASQAIEKARKQVADATGANTKDVYFTSGATESNNWAINSVVKEQLALGMNRPRVVCALTEHSSVLKICEGLLFYGFNVTFVKPNKEGKITVSSIIKHINKKTCLVCVMAVNNELGTANEVELISEVARENGAMTLVDCTQALSYGGKAVEICKKYPNANFFTFSGHKIYGPTGIGCLIVQNKTPLSPMIIGGSQENGLRAGTSNTAGIVGLGKAIELIHETDYESHYTMLYDYLLTNLKNLKIGAVNVTPDQKNIISINFSNVFKEDNLASVLAAYGVAVSAGSACDAEHDDISGFNPSHVLKAIGLSEKAIRNTIRISFTKYTTTKDLDYFLEVIRQFDEMFYRGGNS